MNGNGNTGDDENGAGTFLETAVSIRDNNNNNDEDTVDDEENEDFDFLTTKTLYSLSNRVASPLRDVERPSYRTMGTTYDPSSMSSSSMVYRTLPSSVAVSVAASSGTINVNNGKNQNDQFNKVSKALNNVFDSWDLMNDLELRLDTTSLNYSPSSMPGIPSNELSNELSRNTLHIGNSLYHDMEQRTRTAPMSIEKQASNRSDTYADAYNDSQASASNSMDNHQNDYLHKQQRHNPERAKSESIDNGSTISTSASATGPDESKYPNTSRTPTYLPYTRMSSMKDLHFSNNVEVRHIESNRSNSIDEDIPKRATSAPSTIAATIGVRNISVNQKKDENRDDVDEDDYVALSQSQVFSLPFDPNRGQTIGEKWNRLTSSLATNPLASASNSTSSSSSQSYNEISNNNKDSSTIASSSAASLGQRRIVNSRLEEEVRRLRELVRSLQIENARLIDEREKILELDQREKKERRSFQREYRKRFALLKRSMVEFQKEYKGVILNTTTPPPQSSSSATESSSQFMQNVNTNDSL